MCNTFENLLFGTVSRVFEIRHVHRSKLLLFYLDLSLEIIGAFCQQFGLFSKSLALYVYEQFCARKINLSYLVIYY